MKRVEPPSDEPLEVGDEALRGQGLTAAEIARSPEIGSWADAGISSGAEYVENLRRRARRRLW